LLRFVRGVDFWPDARVTTAQHRGGAAYPIFPYPDWLPLRCIAPLASYLRAYAGKAAAVELHWGPPRHHGTTAPRRLGASARPDRGRHPSPFKVTERARWSTCQTLLEACGRAGIRLEIRNLTQRRKGAKTQKARERQRASFLFVFLRLCVFAPLR